MSSIEGLWQQRFQQHLKDTRRYMKYIFNDHLKLVLVFAIGAAAYYYQQWLDTLTPAFPSAFLIAVIMSLILTSGSIRTFLKRPDLVFMLALESKLQLYFKKSFFYTFSTYIYVLLILTAAVAPLHVKVTDQTYSTIFTHLILLLILKAINLKMTWWSVYFEEKYARWIDYLVRFLLNGVFVYFLFVGSYAFFPAVTGAIIIGLALYYRSLVKAKPLKWETLIELEERRVAMFYRLANLFTDVPQLKEQVKRRAYLDTILRSIPFQQQATHRYLYTRTFLRAGDYLGLLVRLTVISGLILIATPFAYGNIVIVLLTLYITGFQIMPLWKHHKQVLWLSLYPLQEQTRRAAFLSIIRNVLFLQAACLSIVVAASNLLVGLFAFVAGGLFVQFFVTAYIKKKAIA